LQVAHSFYILILSRYLSNRTPCLKPSLWRILLVHTYNTTRSKSYNYIQVNNQIIGGVTIVNTRRPYSMILLVICQSWKLIEFHLLPFLNCFIKPSMPIRENKSKTQFKQYLIYLLNKDFFCLYLKIVY
jgi:hypothetical protein